MIQVRQLSNGIKVVLEKMDYLKSVSFGLWVNVGSASETIDNNGVSHMIEHMLFKGTSHRTARQLAEDMTIIGGNMNAYTCKECTSFYVTTLDEHLPLAVDIISDMVNNSLFLENDIAREKGVIIEEIDMYDDSPEDMVHEMLQKEIWQTNALGFIISGEKKIVNSYTKDEIITFKEQHYTAENMVISIAGNYNDDILTLLEEKFSKVPQSTVAMKKELPQYNRVFYTKYQDIEQTHLNIAFEGISYLSESRYAQSIINNILGGSDNSLLFQVIREELGLTYSIYSYESSFHDVGLFHINAALNPSKLTQVINKIFEIIVDLKNNGISEELLQNTKDQLKTELIIGSESTKNRMNTNGKSLLNFGNIHTLDETIKKIYNVTKEEVDLFLKNNLKLETASISLVGKLSDTKINKVRLLWNNLQSEKGDENE